MVAYFERLETTEDLTAILARAGTQVRTRERRLYRHPDLATGCAPKAGFVADSPLEQAGFELSVPRPR